MPKAKTSTVATKKRKVADAAKRAVRQIVWQSDNTIRSESKVEKTIVLTGPTLKSGSKFRFEQPSDDKAREVRKGMTSAEEKPQYDLLFAVKSPTLKDRSQVTYLGAFQGQGGAFERSVAKGLGVEHSDLGTALKGQTLLAVTVKTARIGELDGKTVVVSNPRFAYVREAKAKVQS